jgi:hypothetical protein
LSQYFICIHTQNKNLVGGYFYQSQITFNIPFSKLNILGKVIYILNFTYIHSLIIYMNKIKIILIWRVGNPFIDQLIIFKYWIYKSVININEFNRIG